MSDAGIVFIILIVVAGIVIQNILHTRAIDRINDRLNKLEERYSPKIE